MDNEINSRSQSFTRSRSAHRVEMYRTSKSPQAISANVKKVLKLKDEKLRKATQERNTVNMKELTFKPSICKKSNSIIRKIVERSPSNKSNVASNRLYRDANLRERKRKENREDLIRQTCPFKPVTNLTPTSFQKSRYSASPVSAKSKTSNYTGISNLSRNVSYVLPKNNEKSSKIGSKEVGKKKADQKPKTPRNFIEKNIKNLKNKQSGGDRDIFLLSKDGNLRNFAADPNLFEDFSDTSLSPSRYGLTQDRTMQNMETSDPIRVLASQLHAQKMAQKNFVSLDNRCFKEVGSK